jgi:hypothetical protein
MNLFDQLRQAAADLHSLATAAAPAATSGSSQAVPSSGAAPSSYQITDSVSVVLDSSGNGTARITPGQPATGGGTGAGRSSGLTWSLSGCYVSVSTNVQEASAVAYITYGIQAFGNQDAVGDTVTGSTGDTGSFTATLRPGDWLTAVWTGGDAGSVATMKVLGSVNPPGVS